nr:hypothetical protein [Candidatus Aminicenantes bacterium]NIM81381.1 hypothetical protein [Candidatus Aminicenantes bacterium]NIN87392.1 hypothetical protein [Candidatus Aminicenantes bacterium]NIO83696.1 hypothetical protein [Candidatus Aminicenantes bacterium]NIQ69626.1 hypothetical protein [Candidatus Aminicenantes bacterium]
MQKKRQPEYPFLYSLPGYRYCDLLLGQGKYKEVMERAEKTLEWMKKANAPLLILALENLSLGRAWMMKSQKEGSSDFTRALDYLNRAVNGLRESGNQDDLPRGLLARAQCYRLMKQFAKA